MAGKEYHLRLPTGDEWEEILVSLVANLHQEMARAADRMTIPELAKKVSEEFASVSKQISTGNQAEIHRAYGLAMLLYVSFFQCGRVVKFRPGQFPADPSNNTN